MMMTMTERRSTTAEGTVAAPKTLAPPRPPLPPRKDHLHRRLGSPLDERLQHGDRRVRGSRCSCRAPEDRRRGRRGRLPRLAPRTRPPSPPTAVIECHRQQAASRACAQHQTAWVGLSVRWAAAQKNSCSWPSCAATEASLNVSHDTTQRQLTKLHCRGVTPPSDISALVCCPKKWELVRVRYLR